MARGFVCLAVVRDGGSRRGRAWRRSIPLTVDVCLEAVEEALTRLGRPEMVTTDQGSPDQGSQVTAGAFLALRLAHRIAIRRDGKGSWRDTVFDHV